jgi:hypothetical protein
MKIVTNVYGTTGEGTTLEALKLANKLGETLFLSSHINISNFNNTAPEFNNIDFVSHNFSVYDLEELLERKNYKNIVLDYNTEFDEFKNMFLGKLILGTINGKICHIICTAKINKEQTIIQIPRYTEKQMKPYEMIKFKKRRSYS